MVLLSVGGVVRVRNVTSRAQESRRRAAVHVQRLKCQMSLAVHAKQPSQRTAKSVVRSRGPTHGARERNGRDNFRQRIFEDAYSGAALLANDSPDVFVILFQRARVDAILLAKTKCSLRWGHTVILERAAQRRSTHTLVDTFLPRAQVFDRDDESSRRGADGNPGIRQAFRLEQILDGVAELFRRGRHVLRRQLFCAYFNHAIGGGGR
mmetsp:Transcript_4633/g.15441  ORF Transcript_4633/g.15441 Transcript_4633/m.15441 type:complete len:208 (+) Transcript_4633:866-1489(+)